MQCSAARGIKEQQESAWSSHQSTVLLALILTMSATKLHNHDYTIRTVDGRALAFPIIVKPDLEDVIIPPPPKPVYALPRSFPPEPFTVVPMDPERQLYQISALVDDGGRLVEWAVSPQQWVLTCVPEQDAFLVRSEDLGSAWVAPADGKFGQIRVVPVPWNGHTDAAYPAEFLFKFTPV
ncbi:hypothetical protein EDC04DRAFT_212044 [Pisolithus marmoratus]|nr:hypothetical protein EDC04DRAFT_212044 [Pisolithus marmoratus]